MVYIILVDMRNSETKNKGKITAISDDGNIATYETVKEARGVIESHPLSVFPHVIVGLDFAGHVEIVSFDDP